MMIRLLTEKWILEKVFSYQRFPYRRNLSNSWKYNFCTTNDMMSAAREQSCNWWRKASRKLHQSSQTTDRTQDRHRRRATAERATAWCRGTRRRVRKEHCGCAVNRKTSQTSETFTMIAPKKHAAQGSCTSTRSKFFEYYQHWNKTCFFWWKYEHDFFIDTTWKYCHVNLQYFSCSVKWIYTFIFFMMSAIFHAFRRYYESFTFKDRFWN